MKYKTGEKFIFKSKPITRPTGQIFHLKLKKFTARKHNWKKEGF